MSVYIVRSLSLLMFLSLCACKIEGTSHEYMQYQVDEAKKAGLPPAPTEDTLLGSSPPERPTEIYTAKDFFEIRKNLAGNYILKADLVISSDKMCTAPGADQNACFSPIGSEDVPFQGSFDGNGHKISGQLQNTSTTEHFALFAHSKGVIKNLKLSSFSVVSPAKAAALVGHLHRGGIIDRIEASESNVAGGTEVGGLVTFNQGLVSNSLFSGLVTSALYQNSSTVSDVLETHIGGLTAKSEGENSRILNSLADMDIHLEELRLSNGDLHAARQIPADTDNGNSELAMTQDLEPVLCIGNAIIAQNDGGQELYEIFATPTADFTGVCGADGWPFLLLSPLDPDLMQSTVNVVKGGLVAINEGLILNSRASGKLGHYVDLPALEPEMNP